MASSVVMLLGTWAFILSSVAILAEGKVLLSELPRSLELRSEIRSDAPGAKIAKAGEDFLSIEWALNATSKAGEDALYEKVNIKLCYAPVSQKNRGWRKKNDDLHKDKTCPKAIAKQKYRASGNSTLWRVTKDVPGATYFIRAYVLNANGTQVAYGQTSNLFEVDPISGRQVSIDVSAAVFSAFSIASLIFFLLFEHSKFKRSASNEGPK